MKECERENGIFQNGRRKDGAIVCAKKNKGERDPAREKAWQDERGKEVWCHMDNFID